ncbi:MAG TPA: YegS/Rv2252/BmrU family lipid kinase [Chitinophagaceae bacterium]|nr:YegS/Rv2252/BmrU family lipid kinase [Chitinophagaceae bacterium]
MSRKLIYLINPVSGTREKDSLTRLIKDKTSAAGLPFEILPTVASGDYTFLKEKILEENITDIVICGGDGSVNQVVYALAGMKVQFGIIPMGSGNGLALAAGIPRLLTKAMDVVFAGHSKKIDAFMVNEQFACMLCGLGFDAAVAHEFALQPKRGLKTYAGLTTKRFFSASTYSFTVEANNLRFDAEAYFVSIANSNQFGNNFTIAPEANLSDGLLDIVIVKKTVKPMLLWNVLQQVMAGKTKKIENSLQSAVIYFQTDKLLITNNSQAPIHIDGEPKETIEALNIAVLPDYFQLIQPL